jgi:hypothetical protein
MLHFHQVPDSLFQVTVFGISHTDGKFFFHVNRCVRNRHSVMVVGLIEDGVVIVVSRGLDENNEVCKACFAIT